MGPDLTWPAQSSALQLELTLHVPFHWDSQSDDVEALVVLQIARAAGLDDFTFLGTIDLTEDTPSGKRHRPVESAKTLKAKEPIRQPYPNYNCSHSEPPSLSATLEIPQMTRKRINDQYDMELLDLELEMRRKLIARREALEEAGLDAN